MNILVTSIEWDTDGDESVAASLPTEKTVEVNLEDALSWTDVNNQISEQLSEETGWLVLGYKLYKFTIEDIEELIDMRLNKDLHIEAMHEEDVTFKVPIDSDDLDKARGFMAAVFKIAFGENAWMPEFSYGDVLEKLREHAYNSLLYEQHVEEMDEQDLIGPEGTGKGQSIEDWAEANGVTRKEK